MDQAQKLIAGFVGLILIVSVIFFIFIFNNFIPPENPKEISKTVYSESGVMNEKSESRINNNQNNLPSSSVSAENLILANPDGKSSILVRAKYSDGTPMAGLVCQVVILHIEENSTSSLYSKKTDNKGECLFYELEPEKDYRVEFFSNQNRMFHRIIDVENLGEGEKIEREVLISKSEIESQPINTPPISCIDSDNGQNYFVRGQASGLTTSTPLGSQNGIIIGQDPNKCSFNMVNSLDRSVNYDCCVDSTSNKQLNEAFCDANGYLSSIGYQCPNGCKDGACITDINSIKCTDSDGGYEPFVFGYTIANDDRGSNQRTDDICIGDNLMEVVCDSFGNANNSKTYHCLNGCKDGACIK